MDTALVSLGLILWILMFISPVIYAQGVCDAGWFGSRCQYKCHCTNNNCDNNGDCRDGDTCVKGWFGPQCQYVDLTYTENEGRTKAVFTDADDTTCNDDMNQMAGTLFLKRTIPFTWLRLHFSIEGKLQDINVEFIDSSISNTYQCNNKRSSVADSRTIDIHCDVDAEVDLVKYTGEAVGYLCSIYVSGGRNIALKQSQVNQSSTYSGQYNFDASNAVDGNTEQDTASGSCTHTLGIEANPYWNVEFAQISDVNRYVIYNRDNCCQDRLKGFVLTSYDQNNVQVFQHADNQTNPQSVYDITTATTTSSIKRVNIISKNSENILTLCEVEIYGDSHCPVGQYGRECEHTCNCAGSEPCLVSTGRCPSGCTEGFTGEHCDQECEPGYYGENCAEQCSSNCRDVLKCDTVTGRCEACRSGKTGDDCTVDCPRTTYGSRCVGSCSTACINQYCTGDSGICDSCPAGKMGDQCNMDCPPGTNGVNCVLKCSTNCKDQRCSPATGECIACRDGYTGPSCDLLCEPGKYGQGCSEECSQFCNTVNGTGDNESPCHHVTGTCIYGCIQGYEGLSCESESQGTSNTSPGLGVGLGIGLGVAALVIIVVAAIYCYWRKSNGQRFRRERPEGYDSADPTTDEHKYSELFKSADNYNLPTDMVSSSESPTSPPGNIPQDTVQYINAEVGHYEDIGQVTSNRESEGHYQQGVGKHNESGNDNAGYANL